MSRYCTQTRREILVCMQRVTSGQVHCVNINVFVKRQIQCNAQFVIKTKQNSSKEEEEEEKQVVETHANKQQQRNILRFDICHMRKWDFSASHSSVHPSSLILILKSIHMRWKKNWTPSTSVPAFLSLDFFYENMFFFSQSQPKQLHEYEFVMCSAFNMSTKWLINWMGQNVNYAFST